MSGLHDRMKGYEGINQISLMGKAFHVLRLDGRSFSAFTANLNKPFDVGFSEDMNRTAFELIKEVDGSIISFVCSDEISVIFSNLKNYDSELWFGGNLQKIVSTSAAIASSVFNIFRRERDADSRMATFDARVFTVPSEQEAHNCLLWRQQDATRNSISMLARSLYSHKEIINKNGSELQEMIFQKGLNWNDLDTGIKRGRIVVKRKKADEIRGTWVIEEPPIFSQDKEYLVNIFKEHLIKEL